MASIRPKHIAIIQGHPDPRGGHLAHALADAYANGAEQAGHRIERIHVAALDFPLLRSKEDWETGAPPDAIAAAGQRISRADHIVLFYPLWLGSMPAILKGFLEQVFRPGLVTAKPNTGMRSKKPLSGKSARIVVTMGMPALIYRWYFGAHSLKSLERNILRFCGIAPVRATLFGLIEASSDARRQRWLDKMRTLGANAV